MEKKTFHIGLCLAGAVSAGAYTAGVMDYLFEALGKWQAKKDKNHDDTPSHNVVISVIGGASAGGMTGIITAAALNNDIQPVRFPRNQEEILKDQPQNKFYNSWVDLLDIDMFPLLLDTKDIDESKQVFSLINSTFIDKIAEKVVQVDVNNLKPLPSFIHPQLKIFTTLTNLGGFCYNVTSRANTTLDKYYMTVHNDYACFQLNKTEGLNDGWMPLDFKTKENVQVAKEAAMATGAFPVGLKSRTLKRLSADVNANQWLRHITDTNPVEGTEYITQNIDGGTLNNEPFEKVRDVLNDITSQDNPTDYNNYNSFKSTILFIDPFPSEKSEPFKIDLGLFSTIGNTLWTLVSQGRAKPSEISNSINDDIAGQFLIAPARKRNKLDGTEEAVQGEKAIACGAFDGFSGFVNKEFRVHDYFLGRYNCEVVLRKYFTVTASALSDNEIFKDGYAGVDLSKFKIEESGKEDRYPIIPIFDKPVSNFPIPVFSSGSNWPVINDNVVERFRPLMKKRVQAILLNIVGFSGINKFLLWVGAKAVLNRVGTNAAMDMIKKALKRHELLR